MKQTIDEVYFTWLTDRINFDFGRTNGRTYVNLCQLLHSKEFVWVVPNDDNRLEDAMELRHQFIDEAAITNPGELLLGVPPLSVLEVIVALSARCAFAGGGYPPTWAWRLIENLELHNMSDPIGPRKAERVEDILDTFIYRNYEPDGTGGMFPLNHPQANQTEVELWYQMNAYIDELEH